MRLFKLFSIALLVSLIAGGVLSCSKDNDEFDATSGNLSGWWISDETHVNGDGTYVLAWHFYDNLCEGEYILWDYKSSGHSRNAFGKWYYSSTKYSSLQYVVINSKVYIDGSLKLDIVDGRLVGLNGTIYYHQ